MGSHVQQISKNTNNGPESIRSSTQISDMSAFDQNKLNRSTNNGPESIPRPVSFSEQFWDLAYEHKKIFFPTMVTLIAVAYLYFLQFVYYLIMGRYSPSSISNQEMHSSNGNIRRKTFQEYFVLKDDNSNLPELVLAWKSKLQRYLTKARKNGLISLESLQREMDQFFEFRSTLDQHTIISVESFICGDRNNVQPQGFGIDITLNHKLAGVGDLDFGVKSALNNLMSSVDLEGVSSGVYKIFIGFFIAIMAYSFLTSTIYTNVLAKRMFIVIVPLLLALGYLEVSSEVKNGLNRMRSILLEREREKTEDEILNMEAVPHMDSDELVDLAGVVYAGLTTTIFGVKTPEHALKQITLFWSARPAIEDFIVKAASLLEKVVNAIVLHYTDCKPVKFLYSKSAQFNAFQVEVDNILLPYNRGELVPTESLHSTVLTLERKMKSEYSRMQRFKNLQNDSRMFFLEIMKIEKIRVWIESRISLSSGIRIEPVMVMFHGDPGSGKTLTTQYMARELVKLASSPSELETLKSVPTAYCYHKLHEKFWSKYTADIKVVTKDDFAQERDYIGNPNAPYLEWVNMGSNAAMPLDMPDVESKGSAFFRAHFVVANTNHMKFNPVSIEYAKAFSRRIDFNLYVAPRAEFCIDPNASLRERVADKSKLPHFYSEETERSVPLFAPHSQEYFFLDSEGEFKDSVPHTYEDIMFQISSRYDEKRTWHQCMVAQMLAPVEREQFDEMAASKAAGEEASSWTTLWSKLKGVDSKIIDRIMPHGDRFEEDDISECSYASSMASRFFEEVKLARERDRNRVFDYISRVHYDTFKISCPSTYVALSDCYAHYGVENFGDMIQDYLDKGSYVIDKDAKFPVDPIQSYEFSFDSVLDTMFRYAIAGFAVGTDALHALIKFMATPLFKTIIGSLALAAAIYGIYRMFSTENDGIVPQSFNIGDKAGKSKNKPVKHVGKKDFKQLVSPHIGHNADPSGYDLTTSRLNSNAFVVKYEHEADSGIFYKVGIATVLKGRIVIMHYHFLTRLFAYAKADAGFLNARVRFCAFGHPDWVKEFRVCDIFSLIDGDPKISGKDLCIFRLPNSFQPRKDIIANFAKTSDLSHFRKNIDFILHMHSDVRPVDSTGTARANDDPVNVPCQWSDDWVIRDSYTYESTATPGDCGSWFCVMNSKLPGRKIFGFHVAGHDYSKKGYAESITQEEINAKLEELNFPSDVIREEDESIIEPHADLCKDYPNLKPIGSLPSALIPSSFAATSIKRSLLYSKVQRPTCAPARLRPFLNADGELVDPMQKALLKIHQNTTSIPQFFVDGVVKNYLAFMEDRSKIDVERRLLTDEEIWYGSETDSAIRGINKDTSSGYPEVLCPEDQRWKNKISVTEKNSPENLIVRQAYLDEVINPIEEKMKQGIRPALYYIGKLKDEKRELSKVKEGKTRFFAVSALAMIYIQKKYYGAFSSWCQLNRINNGMTGGVNVYSTEWHAIGKEMCSDNEGIPLLGAGDFATFDGSHPSEWMLGANDAVNQWYNDDYSSIRDIVFMDIWDAYIILPDGTIVELRHGLPSGCFLTFLINCILNHFYHAACWVLMGEKLYTFYDNVILKAHGDDSLFRVNAKYAEIFNEHTLETYMGKLGLKYTSETKGTSEQPLRFLSEVAYLKRKFRFENILGHYVGPMDLNAVLEPLNWSKKGDKFLQISVDVLDTTLRELSLHGEEIFEKYQPLLVKASKNLPSMVEFKRPLTSPFMQWLDITCASEAIM